MARGGASGIESVAGIGMALSPGRVGENVQLIGPSGGGGGGGAGDVARPVQAPDYAGMYSRAMTAALEPAKFMWGRYKDQEEINKQQQELLLRGRELTETQRANQIREAQEEARQEIDRLREQETERHNQADEARLASADAEIARKNKADEDRLNAENEWKKSYYSALTNEAQSKADEAKTALEDVNNDRKVIDDLREKIKSYGPTDHYNIQDHPELAQIIQDATDKLRTTNGKNQLEQMVGHNTALGQELDRRAEMTNWTPAAHDAFIAAYNHYNQGPEARNVSNMERFNNAFQAGQQVESQEREKTGYNYVDRNGVEHSVPGWGEAGWKAYNDFKNSPEALKLTPEEAERTALARGRDSEAQFQASLKQRSSTAQLKANVKMGPTDIDSLIDSSIVKGQNESDADFNQRKARIKNEAIIAEDADPGGAAKVVQKYAGQAPGVNVTTSGAAQKSPAEEWAARLGNKPSPQEKPVTTGSLQHQEGGGTIDTGLILKPAPSPTPAPTPKSTPAVSSTEVPGSVTLGMANLPAAGNTLTAWDYWNNLFNTTPEQVV